MRNSVRRVVRMIGVVVVVIMSFMVLLRPYDDDAQRREMKYWIAEKDGL